MTPFMERSQNPKLLRRGPGLVQGKGISGITDVTDTSATASAQNFHSGVIGTGDETRAAHVLIKEAACLLMEIG